MDYFSNNTLVSFATRLPEMLDLDESWEIGLAEISAQLVQRTYKRSMGTVHG